MPLHFGHGDPRPRPEGWRTYRKKTIVYMIGPMEEPFTCDSRERKGLQGQPGDYVAEDGHGGYYPISAEFHAANYEPAEEGEG